ncbi:alcohol dehydrogenase [Desulfofundulus australicus DSM 11792]|jgi:alcohol dehydrogenase|uniref:Alcohol dehydrogenase n=1 Tax=Desulfofundulus australicus DSM 11792 TaxID=1121425 RepID=A0A1M4SK70_9FIRM|nr:iron-containing alcohol dehydrogenase [Desulfofundulus australicus]MDK2888214.1 alcohol dehydrogenase [Thermoanaerobacter sp.]SHE32552.1 alcohol dehydrogenase [Desulfofundulus australicus DSM 11792]
MVFPFRLPEVIYLGKGAIENLSNEVKKFNATRVLLITDAGVQKAGLDKQVIEIIERGGAQVEVYAEVEAEPSTDTVDRVGQLVRENSYQLLVGLGGGSPMDVTKGASVLATNGGSIKDYAGIELIPQRGIPTILIPTTSGTGSEVTQNAIFAFKEEQVKKGVVSQYLLPRVAIVDPKLTLSCPPHITAATGVDALVHAVESFTALKATPHTDIYALEAIRLISANLRTAVANGSDLEAREKMAMGSFFAGVSLANAGVGAVHALAYPLGGKFHVSHGVSNALLFAPVIEFNCVSNLAKFARVAEAMGEPVAGKSLREAAMLVVKAIKELVADVGIPQSLRDVGVSESDIEFLTLSAEKQTRLLSNNPRVITREDIKNIYLKAL